jgi:hypothetical protein
MAKAVAAFAAVLISALARDAHACAMCGLPAGDVATHAYNTSVLFMLATPYTVLMIGAVVAFFAYRNGVRRQAAQQQNDHKPQPFPNR